MIKEINLNLQVKKGIVRFGSFPSRTKSHTLCQEGVNRRHGYGVGLSLGRDASWENFLQPVNKRED